MADTNQFSTFHIDILKEIGNIGAGNAATALSNLINKKVDMKVPNVEILSFAEIMDHVGGAEQLVASVFLQIDGDITGNMFFVLPVKQAELFVKQLIYQEDFSFVTPPYPDIAISAFQEMGNILAGSYLSALADFLQISIFPTVPAVSVDMFGAIISFGLLEISRDSDHAIVIDTEILNPYNHNGNSVIKGHFFLLPDMDSFPVIFSALGVGKND